MNKTHFPRWATSYGVIGIALIGMLACHGILDVTDPTLIQDADIANASGADARRNSVVETFFTNIPAAAAEVALFTDERIYDTPFPGPNPQFYLDQHNSEAYETLAGGGGADPHLGLFDQVVSKSSLAIAATRSYALDSLRGDFLAQLFAYRGYAIVQMAEDVCPGFPINDLSGTNEVVYSQPYTTDAALQYGITQLDSALADVRDSVSVRYLAQLVKGRALLDLGQYSQASAAVSTIPTSFSYVTDARVPNALTAYAQYWNYTDRTAVGDREGGNGLPFVTAHDPRVVTSARAVRYSSPAESLYTDTKYSDMTNTPMVVASGVEARLIEAEAALSANDAGTAFQKLNNLRDSAIAPAMPHLADPGDATRLDTLYKERAFWLYLTGRRLGDLRRLIARYGRNQEDIFPKGVYPLGGLYGTGTSIPFVFLSEAQYNVNIKAGCTDR